jgi:hypothetical protein
VLPKSLLYGVVADWTTATSITWGTPIQDPQGATIVWDTSQADTIVWDTTDGDTIVWDTTIMTSADPR